MPDGIGKSPEQAWEPEPAETFEVEMGTSKEITDGMFRMGFRLQSRGAESDGVYVLRGNRTNNDGTVVEVRITRGDKYQTPAERARLEAEAADRTETNA